MTGPRKVPSVVFGADFETDNDGVTAWVVQWAISDGGKHCWTGTDLESYQTQLRRMMWNYGNVIIYFHNLKYDLSFQKSVLASFRDDFGMTLKAIIRRNSPISIRLTIDGDKHHSLTFKDSMKKLPADLRTVGKMIGLPKLESPRGDFVPGWSADLDLSEDSEDWTYIKRDAEIVAVAMRRMHAQGRTASTASGDAWQWAQRMINRDKNTGLYNPSSKNWSNLFPHIDVNLDRFLRHGFSGGVNISTHPGLSVATENVPIVHEDVHNMYGSVLMWDDLPIDIPTYSEEWPADGQLYVAALSLKLHLKDGMIPWFQFKEGIDNMMEGLPNGSIITSTDQWHQMILTSVDLITISHWYDIELDEEYTPAFWIFKKRAGIFREYLEYWTAIKESSEKGSLEYTSAKLMINSLYGRFALAPETEENELAYDGEDWQWMSSVTLNEASDAYLPYAMFVTAYARARLLENVKAVGPENVIHCDTDSVIHLGHPSRDVEHGEHLGTWGIESCPSRIYEGGFKRYIEIFAPDGIVRSLDDIGMACAGVPQKKDHHGLPIGMWVELLDDPELICMTGYELGKEHYAIKSDWLRQMYLDVGEDPDDVNTMKLIPETVPGGTILRERTHRLNDQMIYRLRR